MTKTTRFQDGYQAALADIAAVIERNLPEYTVAAIQRWIADNTIGGK